MPNITRIPAPRVVLVDLNTGIVADEWFRFFNNLYTLQYAAFGTVTPGIYGTPARVPQITVDDFGTVTAITDLLIQIDASQIVSGTLVTERGGTGQNTYTDGQLLIGTSVGNTLAKGTLGYGTGLLVTNGPGTVSVGFSNASVATWAATPSSANLAAAMTDETGSGLLVFNDTPTLSAPYIDGTKPYIDFGNGTAVALAAGRMWYNGTDGSWNLGMGGGNITQQVGEELFVYGRASDAITEGQVIAVTGSYGTTGVVTFAPAPAGLTDDSVIVGIATENIAKNSFGRVTSFGTVHGLSTSPGFADGDILWYDPTTVGGYTKTKPTAPNVKCQVGIITKAAGGTNGSIQVDIIHGTSLGGTDSNVNINTATNGQILTYDGTNTYWKNTTLTAGSGVSISASATGVLTISATGSGGTVTSVTGTSPVVSSGGTTPAISLASGYGDTQNPYASKTANYFLAAPNGSAGVPTFRAIVAADIPALSYVTSVAALTLGTSGTDLSSTVANPTTTPVITLNVPTASATNRGALSASDWSTFNSKAPGVTFTTGYIPFGQGTTTLNQSANLFYDSANVRVGIGTVSPAANLHIAVQNSPDTTPTSFRIENKDLFLSIGQEANIIEFYTNDSSALGVSGKIAQISENGNEKLALAFSTFSTTLGERMRIFASGGVSIGNTTDPGATNLSVTGTITSAAHTANSFIPSSSTVPTNGMYLPAANTIGFATNTTARMQIGATGGVSIGNTTDPGATNLSVTGTAKHGSTISVGAATPATSGAGVTFPAAQSASSEANTLDDYEEGSWTPSYTATTTNPTMAYNAQYGRYTKIGQLVTCYFHIRTSSASTGGGVGNLQLSGLPFTSLNVDVNSGRQAGSIASAANFGANNFPNGISVANNSTVCDLLLVSTTAATTNVNAATLTLVNQGNSLFGAFSYIAA